MSGPEIGAKVLPGTSRFTYGESVQGPDSGIPKQKEGKKERTFSSKRLTWQEQLSVVELLSTLRREPTRMRSIDNNGKYLEPFVDVGMFYRFSKGLSHASALASVLR